MYFAFVSFVPLAQNFPQLVFSQFQPIFEELPSLWPDSYSQRLPSEKYYMVSLHTWVTGEGSTGAAVEGFGEGVLTNM